MPHKKVKRSHITKGRKITQNRKLFKWDAVALIVFLLSGIVAAISFSVLYAASGPITNLHYTANANFSGSTYVPGAYGFNLADIENTTDLSHMPAGVKALVWVGQCNGADSTFVSTVQPYVGKSSVYGYYLMDEPDPTGQWGPLCPIANLKAESDWIHAHDPGKITFIISMNMASSSNPSYTNTYKPSNSDIDLYGLDPYPCRSELNGCDYTYITKGVAAAEAWGIPQSAIVPVYETFGGGAWVDDGGGSYQLPTSTQLNQILSTWASVVPTPAFDYAYSWGSQNGDTALSSSSALQQVMLAHNTAATAPPPSGGSSGGGSSSSTSGGSSGTSSTSGSPSGSSTAPTTNGAKSSSAPTLHSTTSNNTPTANGSNGSSTKTANGADGATAKTATAAKTTDTKTIALVAGSATLITAATAGSWCVWRFHLFTRWR